MRQGIWVQQQKSILPALRRNTKQGVREMAGYCEYCVGVSAVGRKPGDTTASNPLYHSVN